MSAMIAGVNTHAIAPKHYDRQSWACAFNIFHGDVCQKSEKSAIKHRVYQGFDDFRYQEP
jgi:hypothetical protein